MPSNFNSHPMLVAIRSHLLQIPSVTLLPDTKSSVFLHNGKTCTVVHMRLKESDITREFFENEFSNKTVSIHSLRMTYAGHKIGDPIISINRSSYERETVFANSNMEASYTLYIYSEDTVNV